MFASMNSLGISGRATLPHPDNVLDEVVNLANYRYSRGSIFMSTTEILEDLQQHGVHMDARQLQERLVGFDIKRDRTRIEGRLQRGYKVSSILRANRARNYNKPSEEPC